MVKVAFRVVFGTVLGVLTALAHSGSDPTFPPDSLIPPTDEKH